jgi:hypothetical protein
MPHNGIFEPTPSTKRRERSISGESITICHSPETTFFFKISVYTQKLTAKGDTSMTSLVQPPLELLIAVALRPNSFRNVATYKIPVRIIYLKIQEAYLLVMKRYIQSDELMISAGKNGEKENRRIPFHNPLSGNPPRVRRKVAWVVECPTL